MSDEANSIEYHIQLTPLAVEMLAAVKDRREQEKWEHPILEKTLSKRRHSKGFSYL